MGLAAELAARLNCAEYKNWVRAGQALLLLRGVLQPFAAAQLRALHARLAARLPRAAGPRCACAPRARQFQPACSLCAQWKQEILNHHTNRHGDVHWGNCKPWLWPSNSWELAKVITCRNELMHSSEMKVSSLWLKEFGKKIQNLLNEFENVPEVAAAGTKIEKLLSSDWAVCVPGEGDQPDGLEEETEVYLTESQIHEIEMELIRQRLEEIYLLAEEQEMLSAENLHRIQMVKDFLKDNSDLNTSFEADLQRLEGLEKEMQSQKISLDETKKENPEEETNEEK